MTTAGRDRTQRKRFSLLRTSIPRQFGKLFSLTVDDQVFAQPLYVPGLVIPGRGTHNVLFIATESDTVYAFDADSNTGANATPLWKVSLGASESR